MRDDIQVTHDDRLSPIISVSYVPHAAAEDRTDGRELARKMVTGDRLRNLGGALNAGDVTNTILASAAVSAAKISMSSVSISISAGGATGSSGADATLSGGTIMGFYPTSTNNTDQHIKSIVLNANGSITITLSGNSTNTVTYSVVVIKTP